MMQGTTGAMLKQTRPSKFRVPVKYVDLTSGEDLAVPEVLQRQNSIGRFSALPFKTIQRRQRLQTLKKANSELKERMSKSDSTKYDSRKPGKAMVSLF